MASRVKVTTKGLEDSLEQLAQMGRNLDAAAADILMAGGQVLLDGMKRRVPKDTHNLEEHLIIDGPHQDGNFHSILVGLVNADAETARYGNSQEYGTASMEAQPYVRPTVDEDGKKASKAMREKALEALQ